jgi:hypothetical protein
MDLVAAGTALKAGRTIRTATPVSLGGAAPRRRQPNRALARDGQASRDVTCVRLGRAAAEAFEKEIELGGTETIEEMVYRKGVLPDKASWGASLPATASPCGIPTLIQRPTARIATGMEPDFCIKNYILQWGMEDTKPARYEARYPSHPHPPDDLS